MQSDAQELSDDEALAFLGEGVPAQRRPMAGRELSDQEALSFLEGTAPPEPSTLGQAFGSSVLEGLASTPRLAQIASQKAAGALGLPQETPFFGGMAGALEGGAQAVDPLEARGQGGMTETLVRGAGRMAGALPAIAAGPVAAAVQFGADSGVPLYFDIKHKTGDETAALWGLVGGAALGQLQHFGAAGALEKAFQRWGGTKVGDALVKTMIQRAISAGVGGAEQATVGATQRGTTGLLTEALTGDDVKIIDEIKAGLPIDLILGTGIGALVQAGDAWKASHAAPAASGVKQVPIKQSPLESGGGVSGESATGDATPRGGESLGGPQPPPAQSAAAATYGHTTEPAENSSVQPGDKLGPVEVVPIDSLREFNPKKQTDPGKVAEMAEAMKAGKPLPPVIYHTEADGSRVFDDGSNRAAAAKLAGFDHVPAREVNPSEAPKSSSRLRDFMDRAAREQAAEDVSEDLIHAEEQGQITPEKLVEPFFSKGGAYESLNEKGRKAFDATVERVTGATSIEDFRKDFIEGEKFKFLKSDNKRLFGLLMEMGEAQRQHEAGENPFTAKEPELPEHPAAGVESPGIAEPATTREQPAAGPLKAEEAPETTGIKNATVEKELEAMGLPAQEKRGAPITQAQLDYDTDLALAQEIAKYRNIREWQARQNRSNEGAVSDDQRTEISATRVGAWVKRIRAGKPIEARPAFVEGHPIVAREGERFFESVEEETAGPDLPEPKPAAEPSKTTGIKNATVEKELEAMGLPPPDPSEKITDVERHAKAKKTFDDDEASGARLVNELESKPRPPTGDENALLTFEVNRLINEREAAQDAFNVDPSDTNQVRIDKATEAYKRTSDVLKRSGTESSASLRLRQMMLARDYSLAEMERSLQAEKGGKPLTADESKLVSDLHKKIAAAQKAHEEYVSAATLKRQELEAKLLLSEAKKEAAAERPSFKKRKEAIAQSKKRIDEILTKLGVGQKAAAGLDIEKVALTAQLAKEYLNLGYQNFAKFAEEVVAKVGEHIRPYLKKAWDDASAERDQGMIERYKARKRTDIEKLNERTSAGDFESKRRKTPVGMDKEAIRLKAEYESAKREFSRAKERARLESRTKKQKALDAAAEFLNFPRAVLSAFDVSAPGKQGIFFGLGHPIMAGGHIKRMFDALLSERVAREIDAEVKSRDLYDFGEASGLDLPSHEETMASRFAEKIPGVRASNRAFTAFIKLQRAHVFDAMVGALPEKPTLDQGRNIARSVNIGTGRGDAGRFGGALEAAGKVLWSPRLLLSRFQTLFPTHLLKADAATRKLMVKEYARFLAGAAAVYGLAQTYDMLTGDDEVGVSFDPRSSDFGKIKLDDTRIDPLGGLAQVTTFVGREISGEKKNAGGKVSKIRGDVPYGKADALDVAKDFLRSKFSPIMSQVADVATGKTMTGETTTPLSVAKNLLIPISFRDVKDEMGDLGVPEAAALTVLQMFGLGVQTYK